MRAPQIAAETTVPLDMYEQEIAALAERARALVGDIDEGALNYAPQPGSWSMGQCLEHLSHTHGLYTGTLSRGIDAARQAGKIDPTSLDKRFGWFERWFVSNLEPPPRRRFKAPKKVHPKSNLDVDVVRNRYFEALDGTLELRRRADGLDFHRVKVASPMASWIRFRLGAVFAILTAHDRRHLWQAEQIAASDGYPGRNS